MYNVYMLYVYFTYFVTCKAHFPHVTQSWSHVSAPIAPQMGKLSVGSSPPAVTHRCTLLFTVHSIHQGVGRAVVVCMGLCAVQGYFLLLVNILDLGVRRWWETMDWNLTGYSAEKQGLLKDHSSVSACLKPFTTNLYALPRTRFHGRSMDFFTFSTRLLVSRLTARKVQRP